MPNTKTRASQLIAAVKRHVNNKKLRRERAPNIQEFLLPANNRFICIKSGDNKLYLLLDIKSLILLVLCRLFFHADNAKASCQYARIRRVGRCAKIK